MPDLYEVFNKYLSKKDRKGGREEREKAAGREGELMGWCSFSEMKQSSNEGTVAGEGTAVWFNSTDPSGTPAVYKAPGEAQDRPCPQDLPSRNTPCSWEQAPGWGWFGACAVDLRI